MDGIINITMFGSLRVEYNGKMIVESGTRVNKPLELLVLLLISGGIPLSNEQLIERLWENDEAINPAGALKNAAYSLRKLLSVIDPNVEFILSDGGVYRWNKSLPTNVDVWEFEKLQTRLADDEANISRKKVQELAREAIKYYTGEFLPALATRHWVVQQANFLRQLYISNVLLLSNNLLEGQSNEKLEEVIDVCNRAILADNLCEELYLALFKAMKRLGMKKAIANYYPIVSNLFFDQLGITAPLCLREIYLWANEGYNSSLADIQQVQQDLDEVTRDDRPIRGAYFCQYEVFKHMFHMIVRNATRSDNTVVIMLLTVSGKENAALHKDDLILCMLKLKQITKDALRKGDVYSRYSRNQYIIMLTVNEMSDCDIIEKRIKNGFEQQNPPRDAKIDILTGKPISIT